MRNCTRLFLLLAPSLIALGLLGVAFSTHWWSKSLEKYIPEEISSNISNDARLYSTLIPIIRSRGLLSEHIKYLNIPILVSNSFDFREEISREDQLKLSNENCSNTQFTCQKGVAISRPLTRCIDQGQKCNRIINCEDKSDELHCDRNFQNNDCPPDHTFCPDGKVCYRKDVQTCDGVSNCIDDSDEKDCSENKCSSNKHVYCPREKRCARRDNSYRCDGIVDCEDNSDEENCSKCNGDSNAFNCDSKCFLPKYRCDGIVHCSDFRDELHCGDYSSKPYSPNSVYHEDPLYEEKRLNPFNVYPPKYDLSSLESYPQPNQRAEYLNLIYYLQLGAFYGITGGLIFLFFSIMSLFFFVCCHHKCIRAPFYLYSFWTLLALISICLGLLTFVNIWFWKQQNSLDYENNSPFNIMLYQRNPSLQYIECFGLSFWLACGAALATFISLLLSCCICCTIGSSRSENKEYEIMHMQNY
ncbi:unnamed protein product [Adineta steineri]|uniref:Uncharacterized protein n=2 Tax=Adineta steineri TaxID=433720 RepID=A0A814TBS8_9BILA|nr:unnamed protein product [Adineta steineri]